MAFTPRQYRSHMGRNRGWPPRSQLDRVNRTSHTIAVRVQENTPFQGHMTFLDAFGVEADGGDGTGMRPLATWTGSQLAGWDPTRWPLTLR